jgi:predicted DNA-binding protein
MAKKKNLANTTRRTSAANKRLAHIESHLNTLEDSFLRITAWAQQQEDRLKVVEEWLKARVPPPDVAPEGDQQ